MKRQSWYQIRGRAQGSREVQIDIMSEIGAWGISAKQFREDLKRIGETEPLAIHINSDGGDIVEGLEIYNTVMSHKGNVRVSIGALAASMASVIAMAGDEISIADNGFLMIHDPWTALMGDSEELRKAADTMDKMKASIVKAYARQTGMSSEEISQLMAEETWMSATEALRLGFVDSIDELPDTEESDARAARSFVLAGFRNSLRFKNSIWEKRNSMKTQNGNVIVNKNGDDDVIKAERNRISEIQAIADMVLKRDKRDFSNEARKAIADGISADEFSKALIQSDRYKAQFVVGSGEEELPDGGGDDGHSLGAMVVRDEGYQRMIAQGGLPRSRSLIINMPVNYGRLRRQFRPQGATPLTGLPGTAIQILPQVAALGVETPKVADLALGFATNGSSVRYISETSFTNAAAPVAEGTTKPEQLFHLTEIDSPVRKVAAWTKCSDEVLLDHARLAAFINGRMQLGVELALDVQLISGDGTPPDLTGVLNFTGIQTQARGADTQYDAIRKAITKIRKLAFVEPDAIVLHPDDDEKLALLKDANGQYYGGGPRLGPYGTALEPNSPIWRLPPIVTTSITAGTVLVGRFRYGMEVYWRQGLTLEFTNSDQDDFIKNLITIRCELRAALAIPHPLAFCGVTGM